MVYNIVAALVIGYLLGSIPFAYIIARLKKGIDIRQKGSGNIGALAVWREVNPGFGIIALASDVGKGVLTVYVARWLGLDLPWICVAGFAAVAGHNWPVFLNFRGGKGAATIMGVLLAFMPVQFAIGLGIAILVIIPTSNIRLGMIGLACIPLIAWLFDKPSAYIYYPLGLILFLAAYTLIGLKGEIARAGEKKSLIVDKKYNFWQTKKNG
ncbi:MAG TPA: glycerol-3-phosphate acyltransferase [Dehalococcoidales bacterium]|nr:glycerol-3-phosphate acyltransferase [Dehalococcoidales bacterium]